jgi:hypothetical protein
MDLLLSILFAALSFLPTYGSQGIQQLQFWKSAGSTVQLASTTAPIRVPYLANCDTIDTDGNGVFACGSDGGGGGGGGISDWQVIGGNLYLRPTTTIGILVSASSTINANATTTGMHGVGSLFINGSRFTNLLGDGLDLSSGALIFDCSDVASTGITCSGEDIQATLGTSIAANELASADFGSFTCNGTTCTVDNDAITLATQTTGNYLATLSSSGSITVGNSGSENAAVTANLNMGNANTWTALQTFANASTTHLSASGQFFAKDGTETAPGYSFTSDTNTGMDLVSGGTLGFIIDGTGRAALNSTGLYPYTNDASALGLAGTAWSDGFFATGAVIGFGNGNLSLTHSTNALTLSSGDLFSAEYASTTLYHSFGTASSTNWIGGGLTDCDTGATSKLLYDATTMKFSCGTDQTGGGGAGSGTVSTSTPLVDTYVTYATGVSTIGAEAAFTYNYTTNLLTAEDITTTDDLTTGDDFLISNGGVFNWNSGNVTLTHSAGALALSSGTLLDLGDSVLEIPNGSNPTTDATGECAWDTTSGQFRCYDGTANRVLANGYLYPAFAFPAGPAVSTTTTATTTIALGTAFVGETWDFAECWSGSGTVGYRVTDGTNAMDFRQATGTVSRFALSTNNTFTASEKRFIEIGPMTASYLSCTFRKAITVD